MTAKDQGTDPGLNADADDNKQRIGMVTIHAPRPALGNVEQNGLNSRGNEVFAAEPLTPGLFQVLYLP